MDAEAESPAGNPRARALQVTYALSAVAFVVIAGGVGVALGSAVAALVVGVLLLLGLSMTALLFRAGTFLPRGKPMSRKEVASISATAVGAALLGLAGAALGVSTTGKSYVSLLSLAAIAAAVSATLALVALIRET